MSSMLTIGLYAYLFAKDMDSRHILSAEQNLTQAARAVEANPAKFTV